MLHGPTWRKVHATDLVQKKTIKIKFGLSEEQLLPVAIHFILLSKIVFVVA